VNTIWISGQWNVICDQCGVQRKSDQVTKRWDGYIVCKTSVRPGCFEFRHPQDFVRSIPDNTSVPFTRPNPATDTFVDVDYIADTVGTQERTVPSGTFNTTDTIGD
jgi:hypothetical protein